MNHSFMPHPSTPNKCIECGYPEAKHGNNAVCDCCEKVGNLEPYLLGNSQALLTRDCMEREKSLLLREIEINDNCRQVGVDPLGIPKDGEDRILQRNAIESPYHKLIGEARKIDEQLHLSSDLFTANTTAIEELRKAIWNDESIPNDKKFFELVRICKERISRLQTVIFDLDKKKIEAYSEQKAWHIHMNDYANKLRADEREQLRINDVTYDVKMPKPITQKAIKVKLPTKDSKKAMRDATKALNLELGTEIPEFMVQSVMVSKNWSLDQAINHLRRSIQEGRSE